MWNLLTSPGSLGLFSLCLRRPPSTWSHSPSVLLPFLPSLLFLCSSWSYLSLLLLGLTAYQSCLLPFLLLCSHLSCAPSSWPHLLPVPPSSVPTFYCVPIFFVVLPISPFSQPHLLSVPSSSVPTFNNPACLTSSCSSSFVLLFPSLAVFQLHCPSSKSTDLLGKLLPQGFCPGCVLRLPPDPQMATRFVPSGVTHISPSL